MLDFRIFTFLEVCKQMNFTKAAKKLNITQPAVSQHIRWLEKEYGIKLFEMEGKKLSLTEEGDLFRNAAMTFQHDEMYLKHKIQEIKKGKRRSYFGAALTIGDFILPRAAAEFIKMHPDTEVSIRIANTEDLFESAQIRARLILPWLKDILKRRNMSTAYIPGNSFILLSAEETIVFKRNRRCWKICFLNL